MSAGPLSDQSLLEYMVQRSLVSVPEIVRALGVPPSTAVSMIGRLVDKGQAARSTRPTDTPREPAGAPAPAPTAARRGRPAVSYELRLPSPVAVCLFDGAQVGGAIVNADLTVAALHIMELVRVEDEATALGVIRQLLETLQAQSGMSPAQLPGLGLSINAVQLGDRTLASSVLRWANASLVETFSRGLGMAVRLVLTPSAVAEYQLLREPLPQTMALFRAGDGISSHFMLGGKLYPGHASLAGELGHVIIEPEGALCGCGRRGCLEAYCSGPAILRTLVAGLEAGVASTLDRDVIESSSPRTAMDHVAQAWESGDTYARATMDRVFDRLARGLGDVLNLLDPELIVVGGYVLRDRPAWIEEIRRRLHPWVLHAAYRNNPIVPARATWADELRVIACHYHYHTV